MSAAARLASLGLTLRVSGSELFLEGLQQLTLEGRAEALNMAKKHRLHILWELGKAGGTLSNPCVAHWHSTCPRYWRGCLACPDAELSRGRSLNSRFCRRHPMPEEVEE
jgi:hypothetical protein